MAPASKKRRMHPADDVDDEEIPEVPPGAESTVRTRYVPLAHPQTRKMTDLTKNLCDIYNLDSVIVVTVVSVKRGFPFHQFKVCGRSKWFEAARSEQLIGGQPEETVEVHLADVKTEVFREYWEYIYSGCIDSSRCTQASEIDAKIAEHTMLIDLYLLGFAIADIQLRNMAVREMSTILDTRNWWPDKEQIAVV